MTFRIEVTPEETRVAFRLARADPGESGDLERHMTGGRWYFLAERYTARRRGERARTLLATSVARSPWVRWSEEREADAH